jgi:hypothetical protein
MQVTVVILSTTDHITTEASDNTVSVVATIGRWSLKTAADELIIEISVYINESQTVDNVQHHRCLGHHFKVLSCCSNTYLKCVYIKYPVQFDVSKH